MKTTNLARLGITCLLPLFMVIAGCDRSSNSVTGSDPDSEPAPARFTIMTDQNAVSPHLLEGTFEAQGFIQDRGAVKEEIDSMQPLRERSTVHGLKTLESSKGSIKIEFYASLTPAGPNDVRAQGGFSIVSGSGAYESLRGGGKIDVELAAHATPDEVASVLTGQASYAR